ncbi:MAG: pantoate--beta-alanine ligase [Planctomycetaceae bacterium]|jgi:pantoate--beta-alanine ligase|nr:pantoate--beta-alanine ligase [Planctomycetaceae bacterium]
MTERRIIGDPAIVQEETLAQKKCGKRIGVVPTMGALHKGHLELIRRAKAECDFVVVTVFVNPVQFAPTEDLQKYPRTPEQDWELLKPMNVDIVFMPTEKEIYLAGYDTYVETGELSKRFEGKTRPAHFRGVATIVLKLMNIASPDAAFFGQKDYQQFCVVRKMAADLNLPVEIVACPTVREPDGLAMSSRNRYLSLEERKQAAAIPQSLKVAQNMRNAGVADAKEMRKNIQAVLETSPLAEIDYIAIADPLTLEEISVIPSMPQNLLSQQRGMRLLVPENPTPRAVVLLAVRFGKTRLIDNCLLY